MNFSQIEEALYQYIAQIVIAPMPDNAKKFLFLVGVKVMLPQYIAEYTPVIQKCFVDDAGNIDLDKLQKILQDTFKEIPNVRMGEFGFSVSDVPQFIDFLKKTSQPNNIQR